MSYLNKLNQIIQICSSFELRYDLNQIFGLSSWCKLIYITYKDFEN